MVNNIPLELHISFTISTVALSYKFAGLGLAQLVGQEHLQFKSRQSAPNVPVAQLEEYPPSKRMVAGSIPAGNDSLVKREQDLLASQSSNSPFLGLLSFLNETWS